MTSFVLLRGLTREARHWGDFPALLAVQQPGASVHCLDLPGNGRFNRQRSPATVVGMMEFCRAQLQLDGLAPPYCLVAMSLGAMVATAWAQRYPAQLSGAVLINTSMRPFSPFWQRLRPQNYARLMRLLVLNPTAREREVLALTSQMTRLDAHRSHAALLQWVRWATQAPVSASNAWRQLLAAARFRAARSRPATPLLLLVGAADALVHPACSHAIAQAWDCSLLEHPRAGHDLPLDDGAWLAHTIDHWLPNGLKK